MRPIIRDRKFLNYLRTQRCIFTGRRGSDVESVDPAHIGSAGRGIKSSDDEALPVIHSKHLEMHTHGDLTVFREAPPHILRAAFRALAREMYREWKNG